MKQVMKSYISFPCITNQPKISLQKKIPLFYGGGIFLEGINYAIGELVNQINH